MKRVAATAVLGIASVFLSGCFVSQTALIAPDTADYPFEKLTHFTRASPDHPEIVSANGDMGRIPTGYVIREEGDVVAILLFKDIGGGYYIAQRKRATNPLYMYDLVKIDGPKTYSYDLTCNLSGDAAAIGSGAIAKTEQDQALLCHVKDLPSLIALFQAKEKTAAPQKLYQAQ